MRARPPRAGRSGLAAGEPGRTRGRGWEFSLGADLKAGGTSAPWAPRLGLPTLPKKCCQKEKFTTRPLPLGRAAFGASQTRRDGRAALWDPPVDRGARWAAVCAVAQSRTRLKRLSSSSMGFPKEKPRCTDHAILVWPWDARCGRSYSRLVFGVALKRSLTAYGFLSRSWMSYSTWYKQFRAGEKPSEPCDSTPLECAWNNKGDLKGFYGRG